MRSGAVLHLEREAAIEEEEEEEVGTGTTFLSTNDHLLFAPGTRI